MPFQPRIINLVSGKGGTGKSLVAVTLGRMLAQEGARVVLVDADVFVRGLTAIVQTQRESRRLVSTGATVADLLGLTRSPREPVRSQLATIDFLDIEIVPAVREIDEDLKYISGGGEKSREAEGLSLLFEMLRALPADVVIVDNRAGIDELIIKSCELSDVVLSITESDRIARLTNDNVRRHISRKLRTKPYTLINKVTRLGAVERLEEYQIEVREQGFEVIGAIPFDRDILESYGSETMWSGLNRSHFAYALADSWNHLARSERVPFRIDMGRFRRLIRGSAVRPALLALPQRLSVLSGVLSLIAWGATRVVGNFSSVSELFLVFGLLLILMPLLVDALGLGGSSRRE